MPTNKWWTAARDERLWLETTDRADIGVDLKAPQTDDKGGIHPAYALVVEARPGDVVLHYHTAQRQLAAWSRVRSEPFEEDIVWASHGTVAREAGVAPYRRPGWRVLLEGPFPLERPVTLSDLRLLEPRIRHSFAELRAKYEGSLYLPFALSDRRPIRPTQFYLTKMPRATAAVLTNVSVIERQIESALADAALAARPMGLAYRRADEEAYTSTRDPFSVDPNLVDRGLRGHAVTQNLLARWAQERGGATVARARPDEPQYDLLWADHRSVYVAEVKSLTEANEERQLRLGLGQVLRYAHLIRSARPEMTVVPVLCVERQPRDSTWHELCLQLGVRLVWPALLSSLRYDEL